MIAALTVLAVLPAAFGQLDALSEIPAALWDNTVDSSGGGVCLLQREQGQLRRSEEKGKAKEVIAPQALTTVHDLDEKKTAAEVKLPQRREQALPQVSSDSANNRSSLAGSSVWHPMPLTAGVSEGMALDYSAQALSQVVVTRSARGQSAAEADQKESEPPTKNKIVLMVIEMFPLCWLFAVDRFYLGNIGLGIAKLSVSLGTCFIGGAIWGLVDFIIIVHNALRQEQTLHAAGLSAQFPKSQLHMAFVLAIVDILMIPALIGLARFVWWWRKQQRMERLKEAAMRSPHYGIEPRQVKGG